MKVLVLDGNQNQSVACVRSLACAGHRVFVGEASAWSKAALSRFAKGSFQYPSPQGSADGFVERIAEVASNEPGTFVLPATEATTLPLSAMRDRIFAAGARMVLPDHADLLRACNKEETTKLASSLGIAVPKTLTVQTPEDAQRAATALTYPVVLKPRSSEELSASGAVHATGRPRYARNPQEFLEAYTQISQKSSAVLVQEFVEGAGMGYFALMHHGEMRAEFGHLRLRDVHPSGSGSALRVSVELDPQVRKAGLAMLQSLRWHGAAMVEFRKAADKPPVFMEVNGRLWHSLPLAYYAGADFPAWLAEMAENGDIKAPASYQRGVRCRWFLGDFRHLLAVLRGAPKGYPLPYPSRIATLLAEMIPVPGTFHDNFNWNDPLPEFGDWLSFLERVLKQRSSQEGVHAQGRYSHS